MSSRLCPIARRAEGDVAVRVVDEYGTEFSRPIFSGPLTLGELIAVIDGVDFLADENPWGGLVLGTIRRWFAPDDCDRLRDAVRVSSAFYPDLARYYDEAVPDLLGELSEAYE